MAIISSDEYHEQICDPRITEGEPLVDRDVFYSLLKKLVSTTHDNRGFDRESFIGVLREICETYNIAKGVSEFYQDVSMEKRKEGEIFCDYDTGKGDILLLKNRVLSSTGAIVVSSLYVSKDAKVMSREDLENVDLLLRSMMSFISRRRLQKTLERYLFFDETGYPNMRKVTHTINQMIENKTLSGMITICFDMRNFSLVNRSVGRKTGDIVLRNFFETVKDTIGSEGCIGRLGGDKFVCVFTEKVKDAVFELLSGTNVSLDGDDRGIKVSASVGIYVIPEDTTLRDMGEVMERLMTASNIAKQRNDGTFVYYEEKLRQTGEHVKMVHQKFRAAMKAEEFKVYYQPKVDINNRIMVGAEALCRWFSDGRRVMPGEFIPILEQNADICDLDFYMLDHACKDIRRRLNVDGMGIRVSVNFSRKHIMNMDFFNRILKIVDDNNVPHDLIEIELTETTTDVQFKELKHVVEELKSAGIRTAVDDFGIGYSSLNLIREIPWDVLKIDRCFLPDGKDEHLSKTKAMFKHVVSMAQDMGLECVVEGVETQEHIDILRENNCSIAQGYYFDKPLPVEEFRLRLGTDCYNV